VRTCHRRHRRDRRRLPRPARRALAGGDASHRRGVHARRARGGARGARGPQERARHRPARAAPRAAHRGTQGAGRRRQRAQDRHRAGARRARDRAHRGGGAAAPARRPLDARAAAVAGRPAPGDAGHRGDRGDLPRAGLHRGARARGRDRVVQLHGAQLPARPPGDGHARHALPERRRAAAHAHLARAGAHPPAVRAAGARAHSRQRLPPRLLRRVARADVRAGRGARGGRGDQLRGPQGHAHPLRAPLLRRHQDPLPTELLPLHRAVGRDGRGVPAVQGRGLRGVQADGLDGDPRLGDGAPGGARSRGRRRGALHRLRLGDGPGAHRDAALRHPRHPHAVRFGRAVPATVRGV
ncbi:MAG: Phenylalanyl-tRNA synthetase alpha chain, partial [uncultured Gemmatimonadaceae bacterium]